MTIPVTSTNLLAATPGLSSAHTLQAAIELVYVQAANDVLYKHMLGLQSALGITNNVIITLTQLQNLHNEVSIVNKGTFGFNFNEQVGASQYAADYQAQASAYFGTPIKISAKFPSGIAAFNAQILALEKQVSAQVILLSGTTPVLSTTGQPDSNSLLSVLRTVLADMKNQNVGTASGSLKWVVDNYNKVTSAGTASAGAIQQHITNAITAAESLNTTQTETVRNFLFLFEEYYKSASAILQQMTQIIQTMAQNAGH